MRPNTPAAARAAFLSGLLPAAGFCVAAPAATAQDDLVVGGGASVTQTDGQEVYRNGYVGGVGGGGDGTFTATGAGTTTTFNTDGFVPGLFVGRAVTTDAAGASGTLRVRDGAAVVTDEAYVGGTEGGGATGTISVDGTGSSFTANVLSVAAASSNRADEVAAEFAVTGGATASVGRAGSNFGEGFRLGGTGGRGRVRVDGAGSALSIDPNGFLDAVVGGEGRGELLVTGGGSVAGGGGLLVGNDFRVTAAGLVAGTGAVTVRGEDSRVQFSSRSFIGRLGDGTLEIADGGEAVFFSDLTAASGPVPNSLVSLPATASVLVDGAGSRLKARRTILAFDPGTDAELRVTGGGAAEFSSLRAALGGASNDTGAPAAVADVTVAGDGSRIDVSSSATIGEFGVATLTVADGGVFAVGSTLTLGEDGVTGAAPRPVGVGTATVTGAGSELSASRLEVGAGGTGSLAVAAGGLVDVGSLYLGADVSQSSVTTGVGTVTVTGAGSRLAAGRLGVGGDGFDGRGEGTLTLVDGGVLDVTGSADVWGDGTLDVSGGTFLVDGTVEVAAGGRFLTGSGTTLGGNGAIQDVTVFARDGLTLAPGRSAGELTFEDLALDGGGIYEWEVGGLPGLGTAGEDWDLLTVTDAASFLATAADPFTIVVSSLPSLAALTPGEAYEWTVARWGRMTGTFAADAFAVDSSAFDGGRGAWDVGLAGDELRLSLVAAPAAVPEPGTLALLAFAAAGAGGSRLRRRRTHAGRSVS